MENTIDLIQAISNREPVESERIFNQIMSDRIAAKIEDRKVDIASNLFAGRQELELAIEEGYIAEKFDYGDSDEAEDHHADHAHKTKPTHEWKDERNPNTTHKIWHTTHEGKKSTLYHVKEPAASDAPVMRFEQPGHHSPAAVKKSLKEYD